MTSNELSPDSQGKLKIVANEETSFLDILRFLNSAWKTILMMVLIGFISSITYLLVTPKQYQASSVISMAQIGAANNNNNNNNNINLLGINIEEPALLSARMSSPTSYTPEVIAACGLQGDVNPALALSKSIKLTIPKFVANVVELKTFGPSPQAAEQCNAAIFELIKATQSLIVAPYIAEAKVKLDDDIERLGKAKDLVAKADKSGSAMGAAYLSTRDEIRYLLDEITTLKNVVTSNQNRATRLITPIYAGDMPISPQIGKVFAAGVFAGLFLGLLIAVSRSMIVKLRMKWVAHGDSRA